MLAPKPGIYWTQLAGCDEWFVEEWDGRYWWLIGSDEPMRDLDSRIIGPEIIPPTATRDSYVLPEA